VTAEVEQLKEDYDYQWRATEKYSKLATALRVDRDKYKTQLEILLETLKGDDTVE